MRLIKENFWTKNFGPMGQPQGTWGPIWPLKVVLGNFFLVILNTYRMVYITMQVIALENYLTRKGAQNHMCNVYSRFFFKDSIHQILLCQRMICISIKESDMMSYDVLYKQKSCFSIEQQSTSSDHSKSLSFFKKIALKGCWTLL